MSKVGELVNAIHKVMRLQDDVASIARTLEKVVEHQADIDRRLARIEGMAELSMARPPIASRAPAKRKTKKPSN